MSNYSLCGIDCNICKFKVEKNCLGCKLNQGKIFWGECDLFKCCNSKKQEHCGHCEQFPCTKLQEWSTNENPERIDNLRNLIK